MPATPLDTQALLADIAAASSSTHNGTACLTAAAIATIEDDDVRAVVEAFIDRPDLNSTDICKVLARHGLDLRTGNLARHRRRGGPNGCRCPRPSEATA